MFQSFYFSLKENPGLNTDVDRVLPTEQQTVQDKSINGKIIFISEKEWSIKNNILRKGTVF